MEQDKLPCAGAAPDEAREKFERVWRRVMPTDRPDCPFTLFGDGEHRLMPGEPEGPWPREEEPAAEEEPPAEAGLGLTRGTPWEVLPAENELTCLGPASEIYAPILQEFIAGELCDWRTYQAMARRLSGSTAKQLMGIAADERRHAKRLAAAYFLISGVDFWPDRLPGALSGTFRGTLRLRFQAEQKGERAYRAAADQTGDPCLRELFQELAGDEAAHAWLLRGMLERM